MAAQYHKILKSLIPGALIFSIFIFAIDSRSAYAAEAYDAIYSDNELIIPIITVGSDKLNVRMILDFPSELSANSCSKYCFKVISAENSTTIPPALFSNFNGQYAELKRLWVGDTLFFVTLKYEGIFNGSHYFGLDTAVKPLPTFSDTPLILEDPSEIYNATSLCNSKQQQLGLVYSFVIPVELNSDNYSDFIVVYWCDISQGAWGTDVNNPTPDVLVAFISDSEGNYTQNNEDVFGEAFPRLGGASRKYVRADMNGDGIDDFGFCHELGRWSCWWHN
ncbi:MAG: hypothetical protein ACFHHU_10690 [Porticoccaceae bacterium]